MSLELSSSPPPVLFHTVTLSSKSTADRCVIINIPVQAHSAKTTSDNDLRDPRPPFLPPLPSSSSSASSSSSSSPASLHPPYLLYYSSGSDSLSASASDDYLHTGSPTLYGTVSGESDERSSVELPLTSEQRQVRRKVRHRDIDAVRRGKEASALADLEQSLLVREVSSESVRVSEVNSQCGEAIGRKERRDQRLRKGRKSKAAVMSAAASRISELSQSVAGMQQQLRRREMNHSLFLSYATFFHTSDTHAVIFSLSDRRCVEANDAFCHFTGYTHRQLQLSRLAFCPGQALRLPSYHQAALDGKSAATRWEQWEVDAAGTVIPVPIEQLRLNLENMKLLLRGSQRKVTSVFRIALAGQRLTEMECECWLTGEPVTTPEDCNTTTRFVVVQTSANKYRPHTCPPLPAVDQCTSRPALVSPNNTSYL